MSNLKRLESLERLFGGRSALAMPEHLRVRLCPGYPIDELHEHRSGRRSTAADLYVARKIWRRADDEDGAQFVARVLAEMPSDARLVQPWPFDPRELDPPGTHYPRGGITI